MPRVYICASSSLILSPFPISIVMFPGFCSFSAYQNSIDMHQYASLLTQYAIVNVTVGERIGMV